MSVVGTVAPVHAGGTAGTRGLCSAHASILSEVGRHGMEPTLDPTRQFLEVVALFVASIILFWPPCFQLAKYKDITYDLPK